MSGTGVINPTHFTNNGGILSPGYSPGIMTFNGDENFTTSTIAIEVNGTGVAGTAYDQVVVNGTATLGGTLALTFNFPNPTSGDVVKILDTTALTGTFSTVTGLPNGWIVNYNEVNQGEITLSYLVSLPVKGAQSDVKIMDIMGRPVMNGTIINQKIDVSHLPGGFYILSVFSENKEKSISIVKE